MPYRLTTNERSAADLDYDDVLGVRYEFPFRYRNLLQSGEPFVYYRGSRLGDGARGDPSYLGTGIIGAIYESANHGSRLVCDVIDWQPFAVPLSFRDVAGDYYEPGATRGGSYWMEGVRRLPEEVFERIVRDAGAQAEARSGFAANDHELPDATYPPPEINRAVDDYAVDIATDLVQRRWPECAIVPQPHNNPGFDILIGTPESPVRFVEVKGTRAPYPRFFISEGERRFAESHSAFYTLLIIFAIDLERRSHEVMTWEGRIAEDQFLFLPRQWQCELRRRSS